ncbi:MAG: GAF domain-containing protein [Rhodospirillaceae bacterium]
MPSVIASQLMSCEEEALAHSGLIQPHGVLLFIERVSGRISHVSANCASLLGVTPEALLGQDGLAWLARRSRVPVTLPTMAGKREDVPRMLETAAGSLDLLISASGAGWLLEFEAAAPVEAAALPGEPPPARAPPKDEAEMRRVEQALVEAIQALTGYSRVMLYRFHADWSGEVIAEAVTGAIGRYLGLRFPASDIPANARALYSQTPYRHIADVGAKPVALVCDGDAAGRPPLDITWSDLRSVSPIHLQYLKNMRVAASFSVSVMVAGRLWGLIACHHQQAGFLPLAVRQHSVRLARDFVFALQVYEAGVRRRVHDVVTECSTALRSAVDAGRPIAEALADEQGRLLKLFGAVGGALITGTTVCPIGKAPDRLFLMALHQWCQRNQTEAELSFDHRPEALAASASPSPPCGVLALRLRAASLGGDWVYLYWLRPEQAQEIVWAGNPDKPVEVSSDGLRLSPRESFEKWVEVRRGYASPWEIHTLFAAQQWRKQLAQWL